MFRSLTGIYEPSAIQQLPDGRFLVAEDEKEFPFALVTLHADGSASSVPLQLVDDAAGGVGKLADLEALSGDAAGNVYAITSHSRNSRGEEKKSREKLLRVRVEGDRMVSPVAVTGLKAALAAAHPVLAQAAAIPDVKNDGGLNIEAMEMAPDGQRLLIGFRSPLLGGQAILASLDNPAAAFDGAEPRISPSLVTLDCGGHGLRALSWIPALDGYLLVSGPVAQEQVQFHLWFWRGKAGEPPRPASVADLPGFEHAEGISPAIVAGAPKIMVVSDDGSREEGRLARYLLLDPAQLRIES
jgi:hypothetical protein